MNPISPYLQYNEWRSDLEDTLTSHLQGVSYYAAEYSMADSNMLASNVPLISAYDNLDALAHGFYYPTSDIKDKEAFSRKLEALRLRLIEIIYEMEKGRSHDSENRYYKK